MKGKRQLFGHMLLIAVTALITFVSGVWGALALWYQIPGGTVLRVLAAAAWASAVVVLAVLAISHRNALAVGAYVLIHVLLLWWWSSIPPSNQRDWADDVAYPLSGTLNGQHVTLEHVRNFNWRSDDDYDVRWETRHYDLERIVSADAVLSYWGNQAIAHAMISFGFDDGRHLVFSVEIRKQRGQQYSPIGGFFKQFETALVAADERDIIRVRTNVRNEDDYLYPLRMDQPAMQALFLSYVEAANGLATTPAFYNTFTSNCTTIVYRMARQISPQLPWDIRLLLTGYLPEYLQQTDMVDTTIPAAELRRRSRITERARASAGDDFSRAIRAPYASP